MRYVVSVITKCDHANDDQQTIYGPFLSEKAAQKFIDAEQERGDICSASIVKVYSPDIFRNR